MGRMFRGMLPRLATPLLLAAVAGICIVILILGYTAQAPDRVVINEVCGSNFSAVRDEGGEYPDYVELYNPSWVEVSLDGLFLSDDAADPRKYPLTGLIPEKGYVTVWLEGGTSKEGGAPFGLSRKGDTLYLSDASGRFLDSQSIPALPFNVAWGRVTDGGEKWAQMTPTAGFSNREATEQGMPGRTLEEPVFSAESGFYGEPFWLRMEAKENEIIYYTLDGSEPTRDSLRYEGPVYIEDASGNENLYAARTDLSPTNHYTPPEKVDKATVVRAIACSMTENAVSDVATKVYFVGFGEKREYDGWPVLSLAVDPVDLFDARMGIYGNGDALEAYKEAGGLQDGELLPAFSDENGDMHFLYMATNALGTGREWERKASVSWFDEDHTYCFGQDVGIRIAGQSTRAASQKSFTLFGREIYDERAEFPYEFFPGQTYSTIKIRNGGSDNAGSKIMDAFLAELSAGRQVSVQASRPCVVFLNGEYWGLYNVRERFKPEYLRNHYGVNESNVWVIEGGRPDTGGAAALTSWEQMLDFITECDMSLEENYSAACELLDMQSLIDFCCINLYVDNTDVAFNRNFAAWRTILPDESVYGDGRWRFMLYDMDGALNQYDHNTLAETEDGSGLMDEAALRSLMDNAEFRRQFVTTFLDIANTTFSYEEVHQSLTEWKEKYQTQVTESHLRFFGEEAEGIFEERIGVFDTFFRERFPWAVSFLSEAFGLTGETESVTVRIQGTEGGTVLLNTIYVDGAEWSGQYLPAYSVTACAQPREGYRFVGWKGSLEGEEAWLETEIPEGGLVLEAVFEAE